MKAIGTVLLLVLSNIFMTFAWYGHLKLQEMKVSTSWPLILVILFSWGLAFFEYCAQVPANRLGFTGNGGPFSLMQLKVIQEVVSLIVFTLVVTLLFKGSSNQRTIDVPKSLAAGKIIAWDPRDTSMSPNSKI